MKKWYAEEYEFQIEVTGFLRGSSTERFCRNGEEIGDRYTCTYGCPVNGQGEGICSKTMTILFPIMEAVRSGGDLQNIGGSGPYTKDIVEGSFKRRFLRFIRNIIRDRDIVPGMKQACGKRQTGKKLFKPRRRAGRCTPYPRLPQFRNAHPRL